MKITDIRKSMEHMASMPHLIPATTRNILNGAIMQSVEFVPRSPKAARATHKMGSLRRDLSVKDKVDSIT